jgi:molybdopterin-binding protein
MKLSARNQMKGTVINVEKGLITARVSIKVEAPVTITAVITKEAAEELNLKVGDRVQAIIKATEVIVAK